MQNVLESPKLFLDKIFNWLTEGGIDVAKYELDHICYRVSSMKRYQEICDIMSNRGQLLSESNYSALISKGRNWLVLPYP